MFDPDSENYVVFVHRFNLEISFHFLRIWIEGHLQCRNYLFVAGQRDVSKEQILFLLVSMKRNYYQWEDDSLASFNSLNHGTRITGAKGLFLMAIPFLVVEPSQNQCDFITGRSAWIELHFEAMNKLENSQDQQVSDDTWQKIYLKQLDIIGSFSEDDFCRKSFGSNFKALKENYRTRLERNRHLDDEKCRERERIFHLCSLQCVLTKQRLRITGVLCQSRALKNSCLLLADVSRSSCGLCSMFWKNSWQFSSSLNHPALSLHIFERWSSIDSRLLAPSIVARLWLVRVRRIAIGGEGGIRLSAYISFKYLLTFILFTINKQKRTESFAYDPHSWEDKSE